MERRIWIWYGEGEGGGISRREKWRGMACRLGRKRVDTRWKFITCFWQMHGDRCHVPSSPLPPLHPFLSASLVFPAEKKFSFHRESRKASFKVPLAPLGANNNNNNTRWYIPLPRLQLYDIRSNFLSEFYLFPPSSLIQCFCFYF